MAHHHLGMDFIEPNPVIKHAEESKTIRKESAEIGRQPWTLSRIRNMVVEAKEVCGALVEIGIAVCTSPRVIGQEAVMHAFETQKQAVDTTQTEFATAA